VVIGGGWGEIKEEKDKRMKTDGTKRGNHRKFEEGKGIKIKVTSRKPWGYSSGERGISKGKRKGKLRIFKLEKKGGRGVPSHRHHQNGILKISLQAYMRRS